MLTGLILENFKTFGGVHPIPLGPLTVIYGANSSGKSSILQALLFLKQNVHLAENPNGPVILNGTEVDLGGFRQVSFLHDRKHQVSVTALAPFRNSPSATDAEGLKRESQFDGATSGYGFSIGLGVDALTRLVGRPVFTDLSKIPAYAWRADPQKNEVPPDVIDDQQFQWVEELLGKIGPMGERLDIADGSLQGSLDDFDPEHDIWPQLHNDFFRSISNLTSHDKHEFIFDLFQGVLDLHVTTLLRTNAIQYAPNISNFQTLLSGSDSIFPINGQASAIRYLYNILDQLRDVSALIHKLYGSTDKKHFKYSWSSRTKKILGTPIAIECMKLAGISVRLYANIAHLAREIEPKTVAGFRKFRLGQSARVASGLRREEVGQVATAKREENDFKESVAAKVWGSTTPLVSAITHIGPSRIVQSRVDSFASVRPPSVGSDGNQLIGVLATHENMIDRVNLLLSLLDMTHILTLKVYDDNLGLASLGLIDTTTRAKTNFVDVGFGLGQIVPVLAEICIESGGPVLIEQPELHLHPRAQASLAKVFVDASQRRQMIIETHSEHLLLAIQRLVQDGEADPKDISVLKVSKSASGSRVQRMGFDDSGDFADPWLDGFFPDRFAVRYGGRS